MSTARGLALVLGILLATLSSTTAAPLEQPRWTAGDFWTYRTVTVLTPGLNLTGSVTSTMEGTIAAPVGGASVDAYRIVLAGSGTAEGVLHLLWGNVTVRGSWVLTAEERFEVGDLGLVFSLLDISVNGTYQNYLRFSLRLQNTTTFQILTNGWRYPLTPGSNGGQTVEYNFTQDVYGSSGPMHTNGTGMWTFGFSIAALTSETVPAGTFDAYAITQTWPDGSRQRSYVSPQVGNAVRTESYGPDGNLTGETTLTSYRYQALETPTFLGLTATGWAIAVSIVAAAAVIVVAWRWRRKKSPRPPEEPPKLT